MYNWFWSLLHVFGVEVKTDYIDLAELNPFDVHWNFTGFSFKMPWDR